MCWVIIYNFLFFISNLSIGIKHRFFLLHFDPIWYRLCIHVLFHIKMNNFVKVMFLESKIFKAKSKFQSNVLKKHISSISNFFASFQSLMLRSFPILKRYCAHLIKEKTIWKKVIVHFRSLSALNTYLKPQWAWFEKK
jgi:hypothetical protein